MWYLITFVLTFLVVFIAICYLIKTQKSEQERARIRVLDIVLGFTDSLQNYYQERCEEINDGMSLDEYKREKQSYLDAKEKNEYALEKLREKENAINDVISQDSVLCFSYPIKGTFPVTDGFVKAMPLYVMNYATFQHKLADMTSTYLEPYFANQELAKQAELKKTQKRKAKKNQSAVNAYVPWDSCNNDVYKVWDAFFFGLCHMINTTLFDTKKNVVRSHVRILVNENYEKLVAVTGESVYEPNLTSIPKNEGMIIASHKNHTSLVKSLNVTENANMHFKGNNDSKWEDYLSFTLVDYEEDGYPLISVGISIANSEQYRDLLYFVNYLRIEDIIGREINRLNKAYDLGKFIREWRDRNGG